MDLEADFNGITKINVIDWLLNKQSKKEIIRLEENFFNSRKSLFFLKVEFTLKFQFVLKNVKIIYFFLKLYDTMQRNR